MFTSLGNGNYKGTTRRSVAGVMANAGAWSACNVVFPDGHIMSFVPNLDGRLKKSAVERIRKYRAYLKENEGKKKNNTEVKRAV